jgi:hypothetical protein
MKTPSHCPADNKPKNMCNFGKVFTPNQSDRKRSKTSPRADRRAHFEPSKIDCLAAFPLLRKAQKSPLLRSQLCQSLPDSGEKTAIFPRKNDRRLLRKHCCQTLPTGDLRINEFVAEPAFGSADRAG